MPDLKDLMLDAHHMNLVHQYLSVKDIIIFYTSSFSMIKTSHQPLHEGLLLYEYPFLSYENETWFFSRNIHSNLYHHTFEHITNCNYNSEKLYFEYSIFIYALLKIQNFDDIVAYLGTLNDTSDRFNIILYSYAITQCFDTNWETAYMILSFYDKFTKPYSYVWGNDKLVDFENFENVTDLSHYIISLKKTAKLLTNKIIKWDYPDLLRFIDIDKADLIKRFTSCKKLDDSYIHKSNCKSHQICEMVNYMRMYKSI